MQLSLGFSPCPNDTFIFDALLHGKVDLEGLQFAPYIDDVEALNRRAFDGVVDVTKLSYHAFAHLTHRYVLLDAGSALGRNCGPLLIAKKELSTEEIQAARIAIPGEMTTANFLLSLAYPQAQRKSAVLFSDIEDAVLSGQFEAGLIIHENRFTYEQKGLIKIRDLGEFWESTTGFPIPLGGIVARRDLPPEVLQRVNRVLRRSVEYAFANRPDVMPFVRAHAQAMEDAVMAAHISLYVTDFTVALGAQGRAAVREMFRIAARLGLVKDIEQDIFL